jgi:TPR repeat protein
MAEVIINLTEEELLASGSAIIGSDLELCDHTVGIRDAAARHLRVTVNDEVVHIEDLNTASGTWLNDQRLAPFTPAPLPIDAQIKIGATEISIIVAPAEDNQSAAPFAYADAPLRPRGKSRMRVLALVIFLGIFAVGALVAAGYGYQYYKAYKIEEAAWDMAVANNSIEAFTQYLSVYPNGRHRETAIAAIERIQREKKEAEIAADNSTFELAKVSDTIQSYETYLSLYPNGLHAAEAKAAIEAVKERIAREQKTAAEKAAWEKAERSGRRQDYIDYLRAHPDGPHAKDAKSALSEIESKEAATKRLAEERRERERQKAQQQASRQSDTDDYEQARKQNTVSAYKNYLSQHPNGSKVSSARNMIGFLYANGRGVTENDTEAIKWFKEAAVAGHSEAMMNLAYHYRYGLGVPKDPNEAARWYRKADAAGHKFAKMLLKDLQNETGVP